MKRRFAVETVLFFTYAAFSVSWMSIAPLAPSLMAFFGVSKAEFALLNTVVTISKVVAPVLAGALALRIGVGKAILAGSLLISFAMAGPAFPSFPAFLASRALFGVGGAVVVTLVPAMVMQWFPARELALVNGINGVAANTGFALAMSLTMPLSRTALGWRGTLFLYGLASLALFAAWAVVGRENRPAGARAGPEEEVGYLDVWRMRETWLIAISFTGPVALYLTFALWLPTYYKEQFGFDIARAARYCSIILYTGIPSAVAFGLLAQRTGLRRPFLISGGVLSGIAAFGVFLTPDPAVIVVSALALGVGLFIPTASLTTLLMELPGSTPRRVALIAATMVSFCYLVTSFLPNAVGWLSDKTGTFFWGFLALSVASWVSVLSGWLLPETGPGAPPPGRPGGPPVSGR
jgi:cyanate permease